VNRLSGHEQKSEGVAWIWKPQNLAAPSTQDKRSRELKRLRDFGIASSVGFVTSGIVVTSSYALGVWLGRSSDNLREIIYLGVPFALLLGVAAAARSGPTRLGRHPTSKAVVAGAVLGLLYIFLLFRYLAGGFLGIVVQALSGWIAGGVSAMLAVTITNRSRMVLGIAGVCLLAIFLPKPVFNTFTHNQQLTVVFITRSSGEEGMPSPRAINFAGDAEAQAVGKEALEHVRALGLGGDFRVVHLSRQGEGRQSLAIVVVQSPVEGRALLAEPNGSTVIYVQQPGRWTKYPSDARTLRRSIEIWPAGNRKDALAYFSIPGASGISLDGRIDGETREPPKNP
jgi:hypothetical protein